MNFRIGFNIKNSIITIQIFFRVLFQLIYGAYKVSRLTQPIVTIFGGAHLKQDHPFAVKAHLFAHMLANEDYSIITGGGPGIMHAASCTFVEVIRPLKGKTLGIEVVGLEELDKEILPIGDACYYEHIVMDYFFARKWLMMNYSVAFVFFPGGYGTLDEFGEVITLIQTKKLAKVPLILIDVKYWKPLTEWVSEASAQGLIPIEGLTLLMATDSLQEALGWIKEYHKKIS